MARCDTYDYGECTYGACELSRWLPERLGNASDWLANAQADGLQTTSTPTVGAVVVYAGGTGYSPYGHCGVVIDAYSDGTFLVREMNYAQFGAYDDRRSTMSDVEGFILPPGVSPGQGGGMGAGGFGQSYGDLQNAWNNIGNVIGSKVPADLLQLGGWVQQIYEMVVQQGD